MNQDPLKIIRFELGGMMGSNAYLLVHEPTGEAVVFDPGYDDENLLNYIKDNNLNLKKILLTHGHYDHIGGVQKLREETGAEVIISEKDQDYLTDANKNLSVYQSPNIEIEPADRLVKTGDQIEVAPDLFVTVLETPGHTPGSVCYVGDSFIVTGDLIFENSIGRTDFEGGSLEDMKTSLLTLLTYPNETLLCPGHGNVTTIGRERMLNPFIAQLL